MNNMDMLFQLQENEIKAAENNKIIKDGSYVYLLKKMKIEFEKCKEEFLLKGNEIEKIKDRFKSANSKTRDLKEKIEADEKMMYSSNITSKTVEKLQKRIYDNNKRLSEMDDKNIILLESEEKLEEEKEILRKKLVELKNNFYDYKEASNKKISNAHNELKKYNANIENIKKTIPEKILKEYTQIKYSKGTAIALIKNGICSGCKMKVSAMTMDQISKNKEKVLCDNCGRILYYNYDK